MKQMILIYDPECGCTMPTAKVASSVSSCLDAYEREGVFKSTYGSFTIIEEFLLQSVKRSISLDCISIVYRMGNIDKEITTRIQ